MSLLEFFVMTRNEERAVLFSRATEAGNYEYVYAIGQ